MRLIFPDQETADASLGVGGISVGSDDSDDVTLSGPDIAKNHLKFVVDRRGTLVIVGDPANPARVNNRQVLSVALLRPGDEIVLGPHHMVLVADDPSWREPSDSGVRQAPHQCVLRGLDGSRSGRTFALASGRATIGSGEDCDISLDASAPAHAATVEFSSAGMAVRRAGEAQLMVNGHAAEATVLEHGDQIMVAGARFLVETPSLDAPSTGEATHTAVMKAVDFDAPGDDRVASKEGKAGESKPESSTRRELSWPWYLAAMVVAAAVGAGLATLLI